MSSYDVVIIGGGLIGCASAYYLSKQGANVAIIEQGQLNQGASGRNAGSLHFQLEYRLIKYQQQLREQLELLVPLTQRAIGHWQQIERELNQELELTMHGGIMVAESDEQVELLEQKCQFENEHGLSVELLSADEVHRLAPYLSQRIQAGLICQQEGHCNPRYLTLAYARAAEALGADILTNTQVSELHYGSGRWHATVHASNESHSSNIISCTSVLNAAGAWASDIGMKAGIHLPIFPIALTMHATEEVKPFINHMIQHVGEQLSVKQVSDGNILIGGGWGARLGNNRQHWCPERSSTLQSSVKGNLAVATATIPAISDLHLLRTWTGVTGVTADQLPLVGEVSKKPGFFVAAGGAGFTFGPTYAQLISELIMKGETSYPISPFSPDRFNHINMFMN